jgi:hypothetical protein
MYRYTYICEYRYVYMHGIGNILNHIHLALVARLLSERLLPVYINNVYICEYLYIHMYMYVYIHMHIHICIYVYVYVYIYKYMNIYM